MSGPWALTPPPPSHSGCSKPDQPHRVVDIVVTSFTHHEAECANAVYAWDGQLKWSTREGLVDGEGRIFVRPRHTACSNKVTLALN